MNLFKHRQFKKDIITWGVRWYCSYGVSYRELEAMMAERGACVDHTTIYRWVIFYAPKLSVKIKKYWKPKYGGTWQVDETSIKVKGKCKWLYRAVTKKGETVDFYLSEEQNAKSAEEFFRKSIKGLQAFEIPKTINTDQHKAYPKAISTLKDEGKLPKYLEHRRVKFLNNRIESDHGKLKRLIKPTMGFKAMHSARATIAGFELMRMFKKGQFKGVRTVQEEIALIKRSLSSY